MQHWLAWAKPAARPLKSSGSQFLASLTFYTALPFPYWPGLDFSRIARFAPVVGCILGGLLICVDSGLQALRMPLLTRTGLLLATWVYSTGSLHLDGAMDTADGLAANDPERRLDVMADSVTGAFGAIAAVVILLLKFVALLDLGQERLPLLVLALVWGRWAQVWAIAQYPYLKPEGKGAFHKQHFQAPWDWLLGLGLQLMLIGLLGPGFSWLSWPQVVLAVLLGWVIAIATAAWFNWQLGGHTGDTYGAVVEWTEALFLVGMTAAAAAR